MSFLVFTTHSTITQMQKGPQHIPFHESPHLFQSRAFRRPFVVTFTHCAPVHSFRTFNSEKHTACVCFTASKVMTNLAKMTFEVRLVLLDFIGDVAVNREN